MHYISAPLLLFGSGLCLRVNQNQADSSRVQIQHLSNVLADGQDSTGENPCYKITQFNLNGTNLYIFGIKTPIKFIKGIGDEYMTASCLWEWEDNDGRCIWIPGRRTRSRDDTYQPSCQPNCLHPKSQVSKASCVDPDQEGEHQLCEWVNDRCRFNLQTQDDQMSWKDKSQSYWFNDRITPREVRASYCDANKWSTSPTVTTPYTPIKNSGQVRFCYGVGTVEHQAFPRGSTLRKICPPIEWLQQILPSHFVKEFGGGRSGAQVWGVMCAEEDKPWTCRYVLKALTVKEAKVVLLAGEKAGDGNDNLLMPTCAWWIPGFPPMLTWEPSGRYDGFSELSANLIAEGNDGGRVWILMPNMAHSLYLPGESLGSPIDVKGWKATTAKQLTIFSNTDEREFQQQFTKHSFALHTRSGQEHWPTKLSRSLKLLAWDKISDYSLFFASSRITRPAACKNDIGWPELILASWDGDETSKWLCVAMSVIDFTKLESDFGWKDAKQTDAILYAQNMLGMFVDLRPSNRLMGVENHTFEELSITQQQLATGPPKPREARISASDIDAAINYID